MEEKREAARAVKRWLEIDERLRDGGEGGERERLLEYKRELEGVVRRRVAEAVERKDGEACACELYEGRYQHEIQDGDIVIKRLVWPAIEENIDTLKGLGGEDWIVYAICELQEECDSRGSFIVKKYMEYRKLWKLASEIDSYSKSLLSVGNVEGPDVLYRLQILSVAINLVSNKYLEALQQKMREPNLDAKPISGSYELSEADYAENELNDPWVQRTEAASCSAVETNAAWLQPYMTTNNYDSFVHLIIDFIFKRLEVIMMQKRFSQLGGLQLDRDMRALVSHFSSMTQRTVREKVRPSNPSGSDSELGEGFRDTGFLGRELWSNDSEVDPSRLSIRILNIV
ncbi:Conserved oligomeric Golgi complex subunit 4-like protein [Drosera capensis]